MATIEQLGAVFIKQVFQRSSGNANLDAGRNTKNVEASLPRVQETETRVSEVKDAERFRESSPGRGRAIETMELRKLDLEELAEQLRKVNLTFDLFEIQARYTVNRENGDISVEVINQRTGEVIRRIPPYKLPEMELSLLNDNSLGADYKA